MPRWMSFAYTIPQMRAGTKDVTRRIGWRFGKPGMRVLAVSKSRGRKPGEWPEVFGVKELVHVSFVSVSPITQEEVNREGFPDMTPEQFVRMFCKIGHCTPDTIVTRIEFKPVEERDGTTKRKQLRARHAGGPQGGKKRGRAA